ncbi:MAG: hypothetical protein L0Y32_00105 [Nevskiales bacterium]|nr:hypothetical protein [Nevskiales bacterium]
MTRMIKAFLLLGSVVWVAGCSTTLAVEGDFDAKNDRFLGEATASLSGEGTLSVQSLSGARCTGAFKYAESGVSGNGTFNCEDGRRGTFLFTSSGLNGNGNGFGKFTNGETFSFRFGSVAYIRERDVEVRQVIKPERPPRPQ